MNLILLAQWEADPENNGLVPPETHDGYVVEYDSHDWEG